MVICVILTPFPFYKNIIFFQADIVLIKVVLYLPNFSLMFLIHVFLYAGVYCIRFEIDIIVLHLCLLKYASKIKLFCNKLAVILISCGFKSSSNFYCTVIPLSELFSVKGSLIKVKGKQVIVWNY